MLFRSNTTSNISKIVENVRVYLGVGSCDIFSLFRELVLGFGYCLLVSCFFSFSLFYVPYWLEFFAPQVHAALVRGRRLFEGGAYLDIYFFYILIQQYIFCLLIFQWTDPKLIVNLELRMKFTRWKNTRESHDNESENISGESTTGAALIRGRRLFE